MCWIFESFAKQDTAHECPDQPRPTRRGAWPVDTFRRRSGTLGSTREYSAFIVRDTIEIVRHMKAAVAYLRDLAAPSSGDIATGMEKINANAYE